MKMKVVRVLVRFHWGYSIRYPLFSASQPAFRHVTPTALIGALAYTISRGRVGELSVADSSLYSRVAYYLDEVLWVTFRYVDIDPRMLIETRDLTRVLIVPYIRSDHVYPGSQYIWAVQTHGKIYAPNVSLEVLYVVKEDRAEEIAKAAWGIVRVGSKESIVSVDNVEMLDLTIVKGKDKADTLFSFPRSLAVPIGGLFTVSRLPIPVKEWYALGRVRDVQVWLEDFVIPVDHVEAKIVDGVVASVKNVGEVILPRWLIDV